MITRKAKSLMEIPVNGPCQRCPARTSQQPCKKLKNLCTSAENTTGLDICGIVNHFVKSPTIPRKKIYSCDEFIAFCLSTMNVSIPELVTLYRIGYIDETLKPEEELIARMELMSKKVYSLNSQQLNLLRKEYEREKKIADNSRKKILEYIFIYLEDYRIYNNIKGGTGVINRVRDDMRMFLTNFAADMGFDWEAKRLTNDFTFWARQKFRSRIL